MQRKWIILSRIIIKWYFQNKSFTFQWYCTNDYEFFVLVLDDIFKSISNSLKRKKKKTTFGLFYVLVHPFLLQLSFISSSTTEEFFWNRHRRGLHESTTGYYEDSSSINPLVAARASKENVGHRLDSIPCVKARRRNWEAKLHIAVTLPPFNLYSFIYIYIYFTSMCIWRVRDTGHVQAPWISASLRSFTRRNYESCARWQVDEVIEIVESVLSGGREIINQKCISENSLLRWLCKF